MRWMPIVVLLAVLGPSAAQNGDEDSVFVYDAFRGHTSCSDIVPRLRSLPLRETVILSAEEGAGFVLDRQAGDVTCVADALRASGYRTKLMVLQDPSFLDRPDEALRRVRAVARLAAAHPGVLSAVVVDLEPYTDANWDCADAPGRRRIAERFRDLIVHLRRESGRLPLELVVPWWFGVEPRYPALTLGALSEVSDGLILMLYGDEGGPVVNGDIRRAVERMDLVLRTSPPRQRFSIALATFEQRSRSSMEAEIADLRERYRGVPHFGGMAVFHATGRFDAKLVRIVEGRVTDEAGQGLAGARVAIGRQNTQTNACGRFTIRDLASARAGIHVAKAGFQDARLEVRLDEPGKIKELAPIVLQPAGTSGR